MTSVQPAALVGGVRHAAYCRAATDEITHRNRFGALIALLRPANE
jgi:hypothetical protein